MAATDGMDYNFVDELPSRFTCTICLNVLQQPQMVNCCEQYFCRDCLYLWKKKSNSCPTCRSTYFFFMAMPRITAKIDALKVHCPNKCHGCSKTLALKDCKSHLSVEIPDGCPFVKLPCPNDCGEQSIFRADISEHCNQKCPKRQANCTHCGQSGEYLFISEQHTKECLLFPLPCPHDCGTTTTHKDLPTHKNFCPLEPVPCVFKELGCETIVHRKDMDKHLQSALNTHLTQLAEAHMSLKNDHMTLTKEHRNLKREYAILQEKHEELQEARLAVENKLYSTGKVVDRIQSQAGLPHRNPMLPFALQQLNTILVDKSKQSIGDSISLALSSSAEGGSHQFLVDRIKFELEWSYVLRKLDIKLFWRPSISLFMQRDWSCDFIMKLISPYTQKTEPFSTLKSSITTTQILAVICCGTPQLCMDSNSIGKKMLIGPKKTIPMNHDVTLILSLQHHVQQLSYLMPASQSMGTPFGTPFTMAQVFTCPCSCHENQEKERPIPIGPPSRKLSASAKHIRRKVVSNFT